MPNPRATPPESVTNAPDTPPPLLLNPILETQGAYPLLRLDEARTTLESKGVPIFDFGTGDPREPTDPLIRQALKAGVPETSRYPTASPDRKSVV